MAGCPTGEAFERHVDETYARARAWGWSGSKSQWRAQLVQLCSSSSAEETTVHDNWINTFLGDLYEGFVRPIQGGPEWPAYPKPAYPSPGAGSTAIPGVPTWLAVAVLVVVIVLVARAL